jgi:hypothetical protein
MHIKAQLPSLTNATRILRSYVKIHGFDWTALVATNPNKMLSTIIVGTLCGKKIEYRANVASLPTSPTRDRITEGDCWLHGICQSDLLGKT